MNWRTVLMAPLPRLTFSAGVCSIAMMRSCFVPGRATDFDDAGAGRLRDLDLLDFREAEWVAALGFDLGLVMGSSLRFARRHPSHHLSPAWANRPAGRDPEARLSRPKSPQQRSDQARN